MNKTCFMGVHLRGQLPILFLDKDESSVGPDVGTPDDCRGREISMVKELISEVVRKKAQTEGDCKC